MTTPRDIDTYGGVFADKKPVKDATTEQGADYANRLHEDVAHMSRTAPRVLCTFITSSTAAPVAVTTANVSSRSHYGTGSAQKPTVTKTGTGVYTVAYAATYDDALDVTETVSFFGADANVSSATAAGKPQCTVSGSTITVYVFDSADPPAASDLSGTTTIFVVGY